MPPLHLYTPSPMSPAHGFTDVPLVSTSELQTIVVHGNDQNPIFLSDDSAARTESKRSYAKVMFAQPAGAVSMQKPEKRVTGRMDRTVSTTAAGLKSLRFLDKMGGKAEGADGLKALEKKFDQFAVDGRLPKENFERCIGMADSKEFAAELFEALARRRNLDVKDGITKEQLKEFWEEMTDQNFDSRLQIFFDMCDKNGDGKLSEVEVIEVIVLSASANKLAKLKVHAGTYAALIMEELDPDHFGYIEALLRASVDWRRKLVVEWVAATDLEDTTAKEVPKAYQTAWKTLGVQTEF